MDRSAEFEQQRPFLFGLAYRMLGQVAEAEDIVQDAYLRWIRDDTTRVESARAYLSTIITRLCLDYLGSARIRRERYVGPWLPEPLLTVTPADASLQSESVSFAFLVLLESLSPPERAVFLLREVFEFDYAAIALMLDATEANCRQLLVRARRQIEARRPRFPVPVERQQRLFESFMHACASGELESLTSLLREDATLAADGGGKVRAALNVLHGSTPVAKFLQGVTKKGLGTMDVRLDLVNGQWGIVGEKEGRTSMVLQVGMAGEQVQDVYLVVNPDKLPKG